MILRRKKRNAFIVLVFSIDIGIILSLGTFNDTNVGNGDSIHTGCLVWTDTNVNQYYILSMTMVLGLEICHSSLWTKNM